MQILKTTPTLDQYIAKVNLDINKLIDDANQEITLSFDVTLRGRSKTISITIPRNDYESPEQAIEADEINPKTYFKSSVERKTYDAYVLGCSTVSNIVDQSVKKIRRLVPDKTKPYNITLVLTANSYNFIAFGVDFIDIGRNNPVFLPLASDIQAALYYAHKNDETPVYLNPYKIDMDDSKEGKGTYSLIIDYTFKPRAMFCTFGLDLNMVIAQFSDNIQST